MTDVLETLGLMAIGAALVWVAVLVVRWWQLTAPDDPVHEKPPRRLWRGVLTIEHTHTLTPETFGLLGETVDRAVADYFGRQREHEAELPKARVMATPPEPEERLAHDLKRAHAVLRGADRIRAEAQARGLSIPHAQAMEEAARMVSAAYDDRHF